MGYSEKFMKERMDEIIAFAELNDFWICRLKTILPVCRQGLDLQ